MVLINVSMFSPSSHRVRNNFRRTETIPIAPFDWYIADKVSHAFFAVVLLEIYTSGPSSTRNLIVASALRSLVSRMALCAASPCMTMNYWHIRPGPCRWECLPFWLSKMGNSHLLDPVSGVGIRVGHDGLDLWSEWDGSAEVRDRCSWCEGAE
jgi:hypothetical protein